MEKLIITVACDSRTSYPHNHLCPPQEDIAGVAQQYIDAVNSGAFVTAFTAIIFAYLLSRGIAKASRVHEK